MGGMVSVPTESRERILQAAEVLFVKHGYAGASVRAIVRAAEVTSPMLYYYFGSKAELLKALIEERASTFYALLESAEAEATSAESFVEAYTRALLERTAESTASVRFFFSLMLAGREDLQEAGPVVDAVSLHSIQTLERNIARFRPDLQPQQQRTIAWLVDHQLGSLCLQIAHGLLPGDPEAIVQLLGKHAELLLRHADELPTTELQLLGSPPRASEPS